GDDHRRREEPRRLQQGALTDRQTRVRSGMGLRVVQVSLFLVAAISISAAHCRCISVSRRSRLAWATCTASWRACTLLRQLPRHSLEKTAASRVAALSNDRASQESQCIRTETSC